MPSGFKRLVVLGLRRQDLLVGIRKGTELGHRLVHDREVQVDVLLCQRLEFEVWDLRRRPRRGGGGGLRSSRLRCGLRVTASSNEERDTDDGGGKLHRKC